MKTTISNHSIEKALHERSSSLNMAITANTNSIVVDDLESFGTNKIYHNSNNHHLISKNNNNSLNNEV